MTLFRTIAGAWARLVIRASKSSNSDCACKKGDSADYCTNSTGLSDELSELGLRLGVSETGRSRCSSSAGLSDELRQRGLRLGVSETGRSHHSSSTGLSDELRQRGLRLGVPERRGRRRKGVS